MSIICARETGLTAEEYIACVGQSALGPGVSIIVLALPGAKGFCQKIGLTHAEAGFYRDRTHRT